MNFRDWFLVRTLQLLKLSTFFIRMQKKIKKEFPLAVKTVLKRTYMDSSMDSMMNEDVSIKLVQQLKELWRKAGMHPRKWL